MLIVDDDLDVRALLRATLEKSGYRVLEAADGQQALEQMNAHSVQLVITDLVMPGMEGIETIRAIRRDYPGVKIVAMSGSFGDVLLRAAGKLGADRVLRKPFSGEEVIELARTLLPQTSPGP